MNENANGYVRICRSLMDSDIYFSEKFDKTHAWLDLILLANFKDGFIFKRGIRIDVKRGQIAKSQDELAERWNWSRPTVNKFLNQLESLQQILQQKSKLITLISICNYDKYQSNSNECLQQDLQQNLQQDLQPNKERRIINNNKKTSQSKDCSEKVYDLSFVSEEFKIPFEDFLEYKASERNERYKTLKTLKTAYNTLVKLSHGNPEEARLIVDTTILNHWSGLFPLKKQITQNGTNNEFTRVAERQEYNRQLFAESMQAIASNRSREGASDSLFPED